MSWKGYLFSQPDSAFYFAQLQFDFAKEKGQKKYMAKALNTQGASFHLQGDYAKAMDYYTQSQKIHEELGNKKGIANALGNIGIIYKIQGDYAKAMDYYTQSLKTYEELGDKRGIGNVLGNIGLIYKEQGESAKAMDYYTQCLKIHEELGNKQVIATALNNIGTIYKEQGESAKAMDYYTQSLKINEELGNKKNIAGSLNNIGSFYKEQGESAKAMDYFTQSLKTYEEFGDKKGIAETLNNIGNIYKEQGNFKAAIGECLKSFKISNEIGAPLIQKLACNCLYDSYKSLGNFNKALDYYEQMMVLKDTLFKKENTKKFARQEMQHEYDKKEALAKLEQEKKDVIAAQEKKRNKLIRNGFIVGFVVMLLFAIVFFSQRNRIKAGKKQSDELLLNILPAEVAEELKLKGETEAKQFDEASILFTDFKGFTAMSEKVTPKELVNDLNVCFSEFDKITTKYGIEKIKTIGDAYMAACGVPSLIVDHAKKAVMAALEMAQFIEVEKQRKVAAELPYYEVRIGIHTGPLVAGIVGVKKFQYDVWGDTVNTASRMESSGEVGKVNISQSTYDLIKEDSQFTFDHRGKVQAKGKGEIDMYFVSPI
ncbi:MAG: adenylate cyclase [Bacteroidia bacterium]